MSFITATNTELIYASTARATEKTTWTTEVQINDTAGMGVQCHLPPDFWLPSAKPSIGQGIRIVAKGYVSTTATPTFTFTIRAGAAGSTSAAILLGSAALTAGSGIANIPWWLEGDIFLTTLGATGANSTVQGEGFIWSNGFTTQGGMNRLAAGAAAAGSAGTVATLDTSITNYINFNAACSASSASNKLRVEQLMVFGLN